MTQQKIKEKEIFINRWCQGTGIYSERLNAEFDQLFDNWISVEDELPKDESDLLFWTEGLWYKGFYQDGLWYFENGSVLGRIPKFWQIPQPPKQPTKKRGGCNPQE